MSGPVKRPVKAIGMIGVEPKLADGALPEFRQVTPSELLVDEAYQRGISERSVTLIRKIVGDWDWRRFKPPVVAETPEGLEVIDGQHTAIAAASHPMITTIPVMVVAASEREGRAKAFVAHNRDRINITPTQLHNAAVAAGDEDAMTVSQVCDRAGVTILRNPPPQGVFKPGETVAVSTVRAMVNRRGAMKARIILQALAEAKCAPVSAAHVKAVEMLLHEDGYAGEVEAADITTAIIAMGDEAEQEARVFSAAHKVPLWRALGVVLFKRSRRGRRRAA